MSRWTIDFAGATEALVPEFFPDPDDPDDPTFEHVAALFEDVSLKDFLFLWNYAEDLTVTITDTKTGGQIEGHGGMTGRWRVITPPDREHANG